MLKKGNIKLLLSSKGGIISIIIVIMLMAACLNFLVFANSITVNLYNDGNITTFKTGMQTVGKFIEENNIKLGEFDTITPNIDTRMTSDTAVQIKRAFNVTLNDGTESKTIQTTASAVMELLTSKKIALGENDRVTPAKASAVTKDMVISIKRAVPINITVAKVASTVYSSADTVSQMLIENNITLGEYDVVTPSGDTALTSGMAVTVVRVRIEVSEEWMPINFKKVKRANSSLPKGETKTVQKGIDGEKIERTFIRYEDNVETKRTKVDNILKPSTDEIKEYGTLVTKLSSRSSSPRASSLSYSNAITCSATAYYGGGTTASGRKAQVGVVAVDPRVIPLGTRLYIESADGSWSYGYAVAGDTGGAVKGNIVDLYFNTYQECINFGRKNCVVYILN